MIKFEKKQIKMVSIGIALMFIFSVVAVAVSQSNMGGIASAAGSSSNVGVIDQRKAFSSHPDVAAANEAMQKEAETAKADFEAKSANMNDQEKQAYYQQTQQRLANKSNELFQPVVEKVNGVIKTVADAKGLSVVLDKDTVVYGGQDITDEVIKKFAK